MGEASVRTAQRESFLCSAGRDAQARLKTMRIITAARSRVALICARGRRLPGVFG